MDSIDALSRSRCRERRLNKTWCVASMADTTCIMLHARMRSFVEISTIILHRLSLSLRSIVYVWSCCGCGSATIVHLKRVRYVYRMTVGPLTLKWHRDLCMLFTICGTNLNFVGHSLWGMSPNVYLVELQVRTGQTNRQTDRPVQCSMRPPRGCAA